MADLLPEGDYYVKACQEPVLGYSGNGVPEIALMLEINDGDEDHSGTKLAWYGYFSDPCWERTTRALRLMGWDGDELDDLTLEDLPNEVIAVVKHEEYEGKVSARVAFINDPARSGLVKNVMDEDQKRCFAAEMKAKIQSIQGGVPASTSNGKELDDAPPF